MSAPELRRKSEDNRGVSMRDAMVDLELKKRTRTLWVVIAKERIVVAFFVQGRRSSRSSR